jgi:hypothetical protein
MSDLFEILNKLDELKYGWIDIYGETHLYSMKDFRKIYKTMSVETVLEKKLGICMEQVYLTHLLLDEKKIPNKMFCTRIYEDENFNDLDAHEHMHCFSLCYIDGFVYHIEHANSEERGIYKYESEEEAISKINAYYEALDKGHARPITEFFDLPVGLTFKEFNLYINSLGEYKRK